MKKLKNRRNKISADITLSRYKKMRKMESMFVALLRLLILLAIGYVVLYPLMYMVTTAFRTGESFYDPTITWITTKVTMSNFSYALEAMNYFSSLKNSIIYGIIPALLQLASCSLVAYGLARFEFREKKLLIGILFVTIILPAQATMLPTYINYSHLDFLGILEAIGSVIGRDIRPNLLNTPFAFYLPAFFGVGLRSGIIIFIYMQFFKGFPKELEEAAWIDGCGPFRTFTSIVIPSSTVVIFTNMIFSIIWHWNDFYNAALLLKDRSHFTLAVSLGEIKNTLEGLRFIWTAENPSTAAIIMAACTLYVLPLLIMYVCLQKRFVKSIDRVGITG